MDAFKKWMNIEQNDKNEDNRKNPFNHFKKPIFSQDNEDDDDFFDHDGLNSIIQQFHEIVTALEDESMYSGDLKKEFQENLEQKRDDFQKYARDNDLDGQIYADQLDALLKRLSPDQNPQSIELLQEPLIQDIFVPTLPQRKIKLSDEQKILDLIHGTHPIEAPTPRRKPAPKNKSAKHIPPANLFQSAVIPPNTSQTWGRTVISIRKSDGSSEVRKTEKNADGTVVTTISKKNKDGSNSTETFDSSGLKKTPQQAITCAAGEDKNINTVDGYKIPNLW